MKFVLFVLALTIATSFGLTSEEYKAEWELFKTKFGKRYLTKSKELVKFAVFKNNLLFINKHNQLADQGLHTYWLKMNEFGDMTNTEFVRMFNGYNESMRNPNVKPKYTFELNKNIKAPDSIDWRDQGYVTPVKNQGQCGSCWAFSTTGSLEGQHFKKTQQLVSLSEQNLVDCSSKQGNQGCNGGLMDQAFTYIKENNGIDTEDSYPYAAVDQTCKFDAANVGATDTGFVDIKSKDESALKDAVGTVGPISVAIDASHLSFQFYSHGVYYEFLCSQTRLDHGVLAVGYNTDSGKDYWIVKNSWGDSWGQKGYIWMSRNRNNNCGIATSASYPLV